IVSPGEGIVTGENDKIEIKSPNSGFINDFNIREGDQVSKGMILFTYTNLDYTHKETTLESVINFNDIKIKKLKKELELLKPLLAGNVDALNEKGKLPSLDGENYIYFQFKTEYDAIAMEEKNLEEKETLLEKELQSRTKQISFLQNKDDLLKKGGATNIDILNNRYDIEKQKTEMINVKLNFILLRKEFEKLKSQFKTKLYDKISSITEQISELQKNNIENDGELSLMKGKVSTNIITSPVAGTILKIDHNLKKGSFIEQYQSIMTVKQNSNGQVIEAKFDAKYRPYIYEGASVKVSVNSTAFKNNFSARVAKISPDSFSDNPNDSRERRYYRVTIDSFDNVSDVNYLPEGIPVNVFATSKKISIFEYIIASFKSDMTFVW
ncbi:HlyD family efflux transporter periplasmic adaptor subunit, partial [Salmonella enterica subsp. enterica serovar Kentucky]|nr:HlyD family efflux transporter periplasmic adaptor subunit [Salmonella enterica subsp. enterica serovar Kentucky]EBM7667614.1 HlyD family efflux transporter periplasmic adaptor subunit [Salmonella enterica subsp. enterica serovar Kentucky]EBO1685151.1 HlyD family efflux transporter periplasmic adaptor subunit [Salmonella enterica subsp. enterica serovar Kentucky]EBO5862968.1 HlyD family efflux transporter periplasmic adaptor subunit [Salmonella enterica subsp. enterica serovar Kentucky]ECA62